MNQSSQPTRAGRVRALGSPRRLAVGAGLAFALLVAVLLIEPFAVRTAALRCDGRKATIVGTPGNDRLVGRRASDVIHGGGGSDRILGGASGNDRICGGAGDDVIEGGRGNDRLFGGLGDDRIEGGRGSDKILAGGRGNDRLLGGRGNDAANGGRDADYVDGGLGDDRVSGGPGPRDRVYGSHGSDRAKGGAGDRDVVRGDIGRDRLDGGPGQRDVVSFASASGAVDIDLHQGTARGDGRDVLRRFERVIGSPFSVGVGASVVRGGGDGGSSLAIRGDDGDERIVVAFTGSRYVVSRSSGFAPGSISGCVASGAGARCPRGVELVTIAGEGGNDIVLVRALPPDVRVRIDGGPGADSLRGGRGDDLIEAGDDGDPDRLLGGAGDDALIGARTDLHVPVDSGRAEMRGGRGDDVMVGGDPCDGDLYVGGPGADNANFFRFTPGVTAKIGGSARRAGEGCRPGRVSASVEAIEGTPGDDRLSGDGRPNTLIGGGGGDLLLGRGERDRLVGGAGQDRLRGGAGRDAAHQ
jgi:Ca2+-binding RTX toxin-like protein